MPAHVAQHHRRSKAIPTAHCVLHVHLAQRIVTHTAKAPIASLPAGIHARSMEAQAVPLSMARIERNNSSSASRIVSLGIYPLAAHVGCPNTAYGFQSQDMAAENVGGNIAWRPWKTRMDLLGVTRHPGMHARETSQNPVRPGQRAPAGRAAGTQPRGCACTAPRRGCPASRSTTAWLLPAAAALPGKPLLGPPSP